MKALGVNYKANNLQYNEGRIKMKDKQKPIQYTFFILGTLLILAALLGVGGGIEVFKASWLLGESVFAYEESVGTTFYFPIFPSIGKPRGVELMDAWMADSLGQEQDNFYLGDTIQYKSAGENTLDETSNVNLTWLVDGPCGTTEVFSDTLSLPPGAWEHTHSDVTPKCSGTLTATVQIDEAGFTSTLTTPFKVDLPSGIVLSTEQGFDRCYLPTVNQMQAWWDGSPYYVWNIYLGGIHFFCPTSELNPSWVQAVAQQGWQFILTWVGPQAPCSRFTHRFSSNPQVAYQEGITEAAVAMDAAALLGISGEKIIYYDLEAYAGADDACRYAARKFLQGWTDWLQLQGFKAGAYGSPCNSYMTDWWLNNPRLDDVWIAHWLLPAQYRPDATVWDVACMNNSYWPDHQRLRQYAGDHIETWGGVQMTIDSNVLDGEITAVTGILNASLLTPGIQSPDSQIRDMDLISTEAGWLIMGDRLLKTSDGGEHWLEITPDLGGGAILDVLFLDQVAGWLVAQQFNPGIGELVSLYRTTDGGVNWVANPLPVSAGGVAGAYLEFVDNNTGWVVIKMGTGSSFRVGQLYATRDGGTTWEERSAPMGDDVVFVDENRGWMVGGPSGNLIYYTRDGGETWHSQDLPNLPVGGVFIDQPVFETPQDGVLPVTILDQVQSRLGIYSTNDGGETWRQDRSINLSPGYQPGDTLAFSHFQGNWWAAVPAYSTLIYVQEQEQEPASLPADGIPAGVIELDFATQDFGWALVQDGRCYGDKISVGSTAGDTSPFYCSSNFQLFMTADGGLHWYEITP